jgi:hypothetical protein
MTIDIEIDFDIADNILKQNLLERYRVLCKNIEELKAKESLKFYQIADLKDYKRYRDAIKTVLRYYMTKKEFEEEFAITKK